MHPRRTIGRGNPNHPIARIITATTLIAAIVFTLSGPVAAQDSGRGCIAEARNEVGNLVCVAWASSDGSPTNRGSGGSVDYEALWLRWCHVSGYPDTPYAAGNRVSFSYRTVNEDDYMNTGRGQPLGQSGDYDIGYELQDAYYDSVGGPNPDDSGLTETVARYRTMVITCSGSSNFTYTQLVPEGAALAGVDPLVLRAIAQARIVIPDPPAASNPPHDDPTQFAFVHIPTWFWMDETYWAPISDTEAQGGISVTVTATPIEASWEPGDGNPAVVCAGPGVAWVSGLPEEATDCSHTYTSSTADEPGLVYNAETGVLWEYSWTLDGVPQGAFDSYTAVTVFDVPVGEIQALETNPTTFSR